MDNILILDTSFASMNKGDDIIMECVREELKPFMEKMYELNLPTHIAPFHWYQVLRDSTYVKMFRNCKYKFVGGSNLLIPRLLTHFPQWNINILNYQPMKGCILVGVGAGQGAEGPIDWYSKYIYTHLLNREYFHSMRDERSKLYAERLGLKALNTGCVTMWKLTPDFCKTIPIHKSDKVVLTLKSKPSPDPKDQELINILLRNYNEVHFWPQSIYDFNYFQGFNDINTIHVLPPSLNAYDDYLSANETDYVGIRLHGGVYAMRHKRRAIIIAIDERARAINEMNHLNCIEKENLEDLEGMINSNLPTVVKMDYETINKWKSQFIEYDV